MSRIFLNTLLTAAAFSVVSGAALAAGQNGSDQKLQSLVSAKLAGTDVQQSTDDIRKMIEARIKAIATQMTQQAMTPGNPDQPMTIGQIDKLNKAAEGAQVQTKLDKVQLENLKVELAKYQALYDALQAISPKPSSKADSLPNYNGQSTNRNRVAAAPQPQTALQRELKGLPRLDETAGIGGKFTARVEMPDGSQSDVKVGDILNGGYSVLAITAQSMTIKAAGTGHTYTLTPHVAQAPAQDTSSKFLVDLSKLPTARF